MKLQELMRRMGCGLALVLLAAGTVLLIQGCQDIVVPECTADADCDDGDACTTDTCDAATGTCMHEDIADCPPVEVTVALEGDAVPGGVVTATATVEVRDGSTVLGYTWAQSNSVEVELSGASSQTAMVTLPDAVTYKEELVMALMEPPITEAQLPPNVPVPEGEFPAGLQNRFQVVGLNPFALEEAGLVDLMVTVNTTSGTYTATAAVHAELPWKPALGIRNVPVGIPVLLHGKTQDAYDWEVDGPAGSTATLTDGNTQTPYFTPDGSGMYTVTVTDETADPAAPVTLQIYAGTWEGVITGQDADGRPEAATCMACHNGTVAEDTFTPWAQTGHAEIFTDSINTSDHYSTSCFICHTVGYDPDVDNGGIDDAEDYVEFLDEVSTDGANIHAHADNWDTAINDFPATAQLGNIQCENCHGPQNGGAHFMGSPRVSLSSDVCGYCHGEPLRHGRFQQWQLSAHANYEVAAAEGENGGCAGCHTGNGFVAWVPVLLDDDPATDPTSGVEVTWTADEIHPITCAACHDPHSIGTVSGDDSNATVRISGDTPMLTAGYAVTGVGKGALCMVCHNSRRGLRNDNTYDAIAGTSETARAPHGAAQTDILMGQNAFLVEAGVRGGHSYVEDTCVNCHMAQTPPPDLLSYNQGGTNHTFYASLDACVQCHGEMIDGEALTAAFEAASDTLEGLIEDALLDVMADQIAAGNTISLGGEATITDVDEIDSLMFSDSHGRQAIAVELADGTTFAEPFQLGNVTVLDGEGESLGALYDFADERLPKAGWNWILVHNDGSRGVHNPSFVMGVLDASTDALTALAAE